MKIKLLTLATVVAFLITSCGGVDKKLVEDINSFEKDWGTFTASVNTTQANIKTESEKIMKDCDETCMMECKDKKVMSAVDSCKETCKTNKSDVEMLMNNVNSFKDTVNAMTSRFADWKAKVMKGEVKTEDANKGLDEYKAKMADAKDQLGAFNTGLETIKTSCEASCNAVKEKCAMMDSEKDAKKGKK
jgi:chromosome segregation ATPase